MKLLGPQRRILLFLLGAALLGAPAANGGDRPPKTPRGNPTLVLASSGGERTMPALGLTFVSFERIYYRKRAPRSEEESGQRMEVEDRRQECECVRLADWSKYKFSELRQIEFDFPTDDRVARLRLTLLDGKLKELRADALYGAVDSMPPRFAATVDGSVREFVLIHPVGGSWPEERLSRILLRRPKPSSEKH